MKIECPKCGSMSSWLEKTDTDLIHRCFCGYYKVIYTTLGSITIEHNESEDKVSLPQKGTKLWDALAILISEPQATSGEITERLVLMGKSYTVSDVSSYLTILKSRGLVKVVSSKRGVSGGSTWELTDAAKRLLGLLEG